MFAEWKSDRAPLPGLAFLRKKKIGILVNPGGSLVLVPVTSEGQQGTHFLFYEVTSPNFASVFSISKREEKKKKAVKFTPGPYQTYFKKI